MQDETPESIPLPSDTADVVEAWTDTILHADATGVVLKSNSVHLASLGELPSIGLPFWESLALETTSLKETLRRYPPDKVHEISGPEGSSFLLRIIQLESPLTLSGGYVVVATDNSPMEALYDSYEERMEDNISAWSNSITLFNAFFDTTLDATFLMDEEGTIIAANAAAQAQHARTEHGLTGEHVTSLIGKRFHNGLKSALTTLQDKEVWTENVAAFDGDGDGFPAEATLRKIVFSDYALFQLILHDISAQMEMKEDLQETQTEVREKEIALKQLLKSVEEDRQELREQLTSQVKKQMLPALERITSSQTPEVREGYKTVIEDQLVDLATNATGEFDSELLRLSPREMEVCQLIQLGRSGKEIAQLLNMSFETVQTHRKNIRKKLGLRGKKASLFTYLRQKPSLA